MIKKRKSRRNWISTAERERLRLPPGQVIPGGQTVSIADALNGILEDVRMADEHWLNKLRDSWQDVAGDVAKHTRPERINGKCLYIAVDSSVWLSELSRHGAKPLLVKIMKAGFGEHVKSVRFQIGSGR